MIRTESRSLMRSFLLLLALFLCETLPAQLVFEPAEYDFGTVEEAGGKVRCSFRGVNRGKRPVVLLDVVTTCGCTVPTFSRRPIAPGGETVVEVAYDPYNRPGAFDRNLYLYGPDRERLAVLRIRGTVAPRRRSVEELYPVAACDGVRFSQSMASFTYIYIGEPMRAAVSVVNTADTPRTLELRPRRASGLLTLDYPRQLAPGERSAVNLCYEIDAATPRYGTIRDALEVWIDGRRCDELLLVAHGIGIDRPASAISAVGKGLPKEGLPKGEMSENILKFGTLDRRTTPERQQLTLRNTGEGPLQVRAVECGVPFSARLVGETSLAPGESRTIEVGIDASKADPGFATAQLLVVTNDPERPVRRVRLTAIVEE